MPRLTFDNAPLIEVIAELKWQVMPETTQIVANQSVPMFVPVTNFIQDDVVFQKFASRMETLGFRSIERLMPPGFPFLPYQPSYRYKKTQTVNPTGNNYLYQIGHGVFTANALPPYSDWEDFQPVIRNGVEALVTSHANMPPVISMVLRYINAFKFDLTGGRTPMDFVQNVLGFNITLPQSIRQRVGIQEIIPMLNFRVPLEVGVLHLMVGDGKSADESAVILDMQVEMTAAISSETHAIIERYKKAHEVLKETFLELTQQIHTQMGIREL